MAVIQGKRIVYLYRLLSEAAENAATAIAFSTENSTSKSRDSDTVSTKSGTIRVPQDVEVEISTTALFASENDEMIGKLDTAIDDGAVVEIWEVNLDKPGTDTNVGKYSAKYYQGYVTSLELSSNSEDHAEYSLEFAINGTGAKGYATVSDEQQELASYVFKDTPITTLGSLTVTSAAGTASGDTAITVTPTKESTSNVYKYKVAASATDVVYGQDVSSWTLWDGTSDITAATNQIITVVECDATYKALKAGNATVTAKV